MKLLTFIHFSLDGDDFDFKTRIQSLSFRLILFTLKILRVIIMITFITDLILDIYSKIDIDIDDIIFSSSKLKTQSKILKT